MALPQWPTGYEPLVYEAKQQDSSNRRPDHVATELCCVLVGTCLFADIVNSVTEVCASVRVCVCGGGGRYFMTIHPCLTYFPLPLISAYLHFRFTTRKLMLGTLH